MVYTIVHVQCFIATFLPQLRPISWYLIGQYLYQRILTIYSKLLRQVSSYYSLWMPFYYSSGLHIQSHEYANKANKDDVPKPAQSLRTGVLVLSWNKAYYKLTEKLMKVAWWHHMRQNVCLIYWVILYTFQSN